VIIIPGGGVRISVGDSFSRGADVQRPSEHVAGKQMSWKNMSKEACPGPRQRRFSKGWMFGSRCERKEQISGIFLGGKYAASHGLAAGDWRQRWRADLVGSFGALDSTVGRRQKLLHKRHGVAPAARAMCPVVVTSTVACRAPQGRIQKIGRCRFTCSDRVTNTECINEV